MREQQNNADIIPRVIAITSGKGGTGKTFFTVNLASALSRAGKRVLLLDGDFGLANVHLLLGEQPKINLEKVITGEHKIEDILLPTAEGFSIIPGSRGQPLMAELQPHQLQGLIAAVDELSCIPDVLLIDTAGSISTNELQLIAAAREVVVVTTPEMIALQDAAEYIRQLHQKYNIQHFSIVANKTSNHREAGNLMEKLQNLIGFDVHVVLKPIGNIPFEKLAGKSSTCMASIIESEPDSKAARNLISIAKNINHGTAFSSSSTGGLLFFYEKYLKAGGI